MKKFLASLASLAIIGSSATSVVSCGPITFEKLMNRRVSTEVYYGTYKAPVSNWSTGVTMQLEDSVILTNAEDTLLATDHHNNFEGDLADAWKASQDMKTWYFHVRDQEQHAGRWTVLSDRGDQIDKGMIEAIEFFNAFRFVFNPNNMSQVVGIWQTVLAYGIQLGQFLDDIRNPAENSLYDEKFTVIHQDDNQYVVQSNLYLDRAILAFNLFPDNVQAARDLALSTNPSDNTTALIARSFAEGKLVSDGSDEGSGKYNLAYHLAKPAPYFESIAAFLSFAPMPQISVDYLNFTSSGAQYGRATKDKFGYQNIWYSGPYVVSNYNPTLRVKMVKNKNYFNRESLKVKELNYAYIGNVDVSRQRFYFETGDISEVGIQPTDLAGWVKYVGNYENPNFAGANLAPRPQASTFAMLYNYHNTLPGEETTNIAVAQRSTRGMIRYVFDRSLVASYYSKAMDQGSSTSGMLRNTWTSKNLTVYKDPTGVNPDEDYVGYLEKDYYDPATSATVASWLKDQLTNSGLNAENFNQWATIYGQTSEEGQEPVSALRDGYDPFLKNDLLAALIFVNDKRAQNSDELEVKNPGLFDQFVPLIGQYDQNSEAQKLDLIKQQVREDLSQFGINNSVTLTWLMSGAASTTINNNVNDAVRTFNENVGSDSPIKFRARNTIDQNDYRQTMDRGEFSVINNGWVPDYADPYTFIHTMVAGGDLEAYTGFGRLFNQVYQPDGTIQLTTKPEFDQDSKPYEDLRVRVESFTNEVARIDRDVADENQRYQEFARVENFGIMETMINLPLLFQLLDEPPFISYVDPFSRSTFTSGQAIYRFVGVKMIPKLWNHKQFQWAKNQYEAEKNQYQSIYPNQDGQYIDMENSQWPDRDLPGSRT